jgi:AraC family transcriptional regulator, regulatory protein of adaptative response / methylated-DNA-[protein]-cysteine methyltransferase
MKFTINTFSNKQFRKLFKQSPISYSYFQTPVGKILALSTHLGVFKASFVDDNSQTDEIANYSYNEKIDLKKLLLIGTDFQVKVWQEVLKIPSGKTITYQQLASLIEKPKSFRAVANSLGSNKIAYFIPCHRVIRKDGKLGGYKWGIDKKISLLKSEK